jgi:hypothetical protein
MKGKRQLLCTFSLAADVKTVIEEIKKFYQVQSNRFFVFTNVNTPKEVFITYNILCEGRDFPKFKNTISVHRKKETNTLFTLNSMNQIIKDENNGVLDKSFSIDWTKYANSFVITGNPYLKVLPIKILEIVSE